MTPSEDSWFIVKQPSNQCEILSAKDLEAIDNEPDAAPSDETVKWGPFETQNQAIAKRIGLIRAGKCQPQL